jgi:hypothetical protein
LPKLTEKGGNGMFRSITKKTLPLALLFCLFSTVAWAADYDAVMSRWSKTLVFKDEFGGQVAVTATYYASEYIEAMVQKEAEKNLWTADELENFKYEILKSLQLDEYIPVMLAFDNRGPSMHMAPFDSMISLWIGGKNYTPLEYEKRFNFKLEGQREGLVFFPKYNEKTGKSLLEGVNSIRLVLSGSISPLTIGKKIDFIWDTARDDALALSSGTAAERLEADRLIKRLQKLNAQKAELQEQMQRNAEEILMIEARLEELQGK